MENASKALIIAGSVLIAVAIVSIMIATFSNMNNMVQDFGDLSDEEIAEFNSKIKPYIGEHISGSYVNALIEYVRSSNTDAKNKDEQYKYITLNVNNKDGTNVYLTGEDGFKDETGYVRRALSTKYYTVKEDYSNIRLINTITVTANE